jgi:hypothetical protein
MVGQIVEGFGKYGKKSKLNSERIWKIWKKGKLKNEKIVGFVTHNL